MSKMYLIYTNDRYNFWLGRDIEPPHRLSYNITPKEYGPPAGGYYSRSFIEDVKHVRFPDSLTIPKELSNPPLCIYQTVWHGKVEVQHETSHAYAYSGSIPCTGPLKCTRCGHVKE